MGIVCTVLVVAVLSMWVFFIGSVLKKVFFPPCIECKHCKYDPMYKLDHRCCKNINKVDATPYSCNITRGGLHCWFEKK